MSVCWEVSSSRSIINTLTNYVVVSDCMTVFNESLQKYSFWQLKKWMFETWQCKSWSRNLDNKTFKASCPLMDHKIKIKQLLCIISKLRNNWEKLEVCESHQRLFYSYLNCFVKDIKLLLNFVIDVFILSTYLCLEENCYSKNTVYTLWNDSFYYNDCL